MKMFRIGFSVILATSSVLAGCSDASGPRDHALTGDCATAFTGTPQSQTRLAVLVTGQCTLSIGAMTYAVDQIADFATGTLAGSFSFTASDGDRINGTHTGPIGQQSGAQLPFSGTSTITGGTGRFADASGTLTFTGTANMATSTGAVSYSGTLRY